MSFNHKTILAVIILLVSLSLAGLWYRRNKQLAYVPLPPKEEKTVTIIPGQNLYQIAEKLVEMGFTTSTQDVFKLAGWPAKLGEPNLELPASSDLPLIWQAKPYNLSLEGYFEPETFRVFADANLQEVLEKFALERQRRLSELTLPTGKTWHEVLTMASLIEREVKLPADKKIVADILWRRLGRNWALQLDATVHYAVGGESGTVFTTSQQRDTDSLFNTYKYPGLPPGPISNPSLSAIQAALAPEANNYWYFLTDKEGKAHYAVTLDEHNSNRFKYLK